MFRTKSELNTGTYISYLNFQRLRFLPSVCETPLVDLLFPNELRSTYPATRFTQGAVVGLQPDNPIKTGVEG